jgi:hypothetical protein
MTSFILQSLMMLSLGVVLYLLARALPRIDDSELNPPVRNIHHQRLTAYLEKIDGWINYFLERFLRKLRLFLMKLDNTVSQKLGKFKKDALAKETGFPVPDAGNGEKKDGGDTLQS